jgi:hypothetical protein
MAVISQMIRINYISGEVDLDTPSRLMSRLESKEINLKPVYYVE